MALHTPHHDINRILVAGTSWLGDAVITLPTLRGIRNLFPNAHIAILAKDTVAELFQAVSCVDACIPFHKAKGPGRISSIVSTAAVIRAHRFDLAVIFPRSVGSALPCFLARIPVRIGFSAGLRNLLLTDVVDRTKARRSGHQVHYYKHLLRPLGDPEFPELPELTLPDNDLHWAASFLAGRKRQAGAPLIALNPGSIYGRAKHWFTERFAALAKRLKKNHGADILIIGDANTRSMADIIQKELDNTAIDATGKTTVLQLAALLKQCSVLVSNDTGPMHLAAAVGTPVVALFGSTDPGATAPLGPSIVILRHDIACSPCLQRTCPEGHYKCMDLITVDEAEQAVSRLLSNKR